jgi:hypothetical protein
MHIQVLFSEDFTNLLCRKSHRNQVPTWPFTFVLDLKNLGEKAETIAFIPLYVISDFKLYSTYSTLFGSLI